MKRNGTSWLPRALLLLALAAGAGCGNREPIPPEPRRPGLDQNRRGLWLFHSGDLEGAGESFRAAIAEARGVDDLATQAEALYNLGLVLREERAYDRARDAFAEAEALFTKLEMPRGEARAIAARGTLAAEGGHFEEAREALERALERAPDEITAEIRTELAAVVFALGDAARARKLAEEAIESATDSLVLADSLFRFAQIVLRDGETQAATEALERALDLDRFSGRRRHIARTLSLLAEIALREGRTEAAEDYTQRAAAVIAAIEAETGSAEPVRSEAPLGEGALSRSH